MDPVAGIDARVYGDLPLVQSQIKTDRKWCEIDAKLNSPAMAGQSGWVRARVHSIRIGGKIGFIVLRRGFFTLQCVLAETDKTPKDMLKFAQK